ncbi:hypothetical protein SUGI_0841210 [Cryptomeria japonica]|nr:hypothetical protein SUGI_0841210 [Cryptomeria japonica]
MGFTTMIIVGCIHLSFLVVFNAAARPCNAGDCSKNAEVLLTNQTAKAMHEGKYRNALSTKDLHYERSSSSKKENSMDVKHARKRKGFMSSSMQINQKMATRSSSRTKNGRSDFTSHRDYDSYDPAPALVKPPFKVIPN